MPTRRPTFEELEAKLTDRLRQFRDTSLWQFSVPPGWLRLVGELDRKLAEVAGRPDYCTFTQLKEKFGGLRFYVDLTPGLPADTVKLLHEKISEYEALSVHVCESCGRPGILDDYVEGWWRTLCEECADGYLASSSK